MASVFTESDADVPSTIVTLLFPPKAPVYLLLGEYPLVLAVALLLVFAPVGLQTWLCDNAQCLSMYLFAATVVGMTFVCGGCGLSIGCPLPAMIAVMVGVAGTILLVKSFRETFCPRDESPSSDSASNSDESNELNFPYDSNECKESTKLV